MAFEIFSGFSQYLQIDAFQWNYSLDELLQKNTSEMGIACETIAPKIYFE